MREYVSDLFKVYKPMVNHRKVQLCIWMFACCLRVNFGSGDFEWVRSRDFGRSWSVLWNDCWLLWDGQHRTSRPRICRSTASLAGVFLRVPRARLLFSTDPIDCFLFPVVEMYLLCAPFFFWLYCVLTYVTMNRRLGAALTRKLTFRANGSKVWVW